MLMPNIKRPYEIFVGEELKVAELIQRRRLQMLVHSYIYYKMDNNVITDSQWSQWAIELRDLQEKYPNIEKQVPYREGFEEWDGSTGAFLPLEQDWIVRKANQLSHKIAPVVKAVPKKQKPVRKSLF